jgi:signal peptidase I
MTRVNDERRQLKFSLAVEVLRSTGEARLFASGGSMLPSIWPGDILEIHRVAAADLAPDDIVVFARENRLVVHRILSLNREQDEIVIITRGDRSQRSDAPVLAAELLGKVRTIERQGRKVHSQRTQWTKCVSLVLLHSELCTRILLYLAAIRHNSLILDRVWAS